MMAQKTIHYSIYVFLLFLIVYNLLKKGYELFESDYLSVNDYHEHECTFKS